MNIENVTFSVKKNIFMALSVLQNPELQGFCFLTKTLKLTTNILILKNNSGVLKL